MDPKPDTRTEGSAQHELVEMIDRHGPLPFDRVLEVALYDAAVGFYETGGAAGRREGDFLTSPEVGPLFGAVVARALDGWWRDLGEPDPFVVVDAGAGPGTLAVSVRAAGPACLPALRYVLVERSAAQRAGHAAHLDLWSPEMIGSGRGPQFVSLGELPAGSFTGVVLANELLDNLPFRLLERRPDGWDEVRAVREVSGRGLAEEAVPAADRDVALAQRLTGDAAPGSRIPLQEAAASWLHEVIELLTGGRVVVVDYADTTAGMAARGTAWLRTYRGHRRGGGPLDHLGGQDVTSEVAVDQLSRVRPPDLDRSQADFLRAHGLGELVDEGLRVWQERAHLGDLEAVRARSRVTEAEALVDPTGLGAFRVLEWIVG
jgi:SAM-dependent MidA family methyltransferase